MALYSDIRLDFNYMLTEKLDSEHGLTAEEIESAFPAAIEIQKALNDLRNLGQLPFQDLPFETESIKKILKTGEEIQTKFRDIVVLGIGGSGLGPACTYQFLKTQQLPRLSVIDNVDPCAWQEIEANIEIEKTFFIVISKSGKTVETLAAFAYFRDKLIHQLGKNSYKKNLSIITDPESGPLRAIADEEKILNFSIPPAVGGRYSVLTPVGLFPAACIGLDIESLLAGARSMHERSLSTDLWINPPYLAAVLAFLSATKKGKNIRTLMPYTEKLEIFTEWFSQLWAESLGKRKNLKGEEIFAGTTPARAMGATDQHSQLQLYLEGPRDKFITFYTVQDSTNSVIPESYNQCEEMKKLSGKAVKELLDIEYRATERALKNHGIPSLTVKIPHFDAASLGQLFYLAELETVVAGELYNVNPFDQPAVESIKKYIKALLDMPGFEKELKEIEGDSKDKRYII